MSFHARYIPACRLKKRKKEKEEKKKEKKLKKKKKRFIRKFELGTSAPYAGTLLTAPPTRLKNSYAKRYFRVRIFNCCFLWNGCSLHLKSIQVYLLSNPFHPAKAHLDLTSQSYTWEVLLISSPQNSVIINYRISENHEFDWNGVHILNEKPSLAKQLISEMLFIKCQRKSLKSDIKFCLFFSMHEFRVVMVQSLITSKYYS